MKNGNEKFNDYDHNEYENEIKRKIAEQKNSSRAISAFIFSIINLHFFLLPQICFFLLIVIYIWAIMGLKSKNRRLAIAAIVIASIETFILLLYFYTYLLNL